MKGLIVPFVRAADDAAPSRATGQAAATTKGALKNTLVEIYKPEELVERLNIALPENGRGKDGLLETIQGLLAHSVATWIRASIG